jgi:hypothetical protein
MPPSNGIPLVDTYGVLGMAWGTFELLGLDLAIFPSCRRVVQQVPDPFDRI